MSKKRRNKKAAEAVVADEVLAEGSGPHALPEEEGVVAVQVSTAPLDDGDAPEVVAEVLAEAAPESAPAPPREAKKSRKSKKAASQEAVEAEAPQAEVPDAEVMQAASDENIVEAAADAEVAADAVAEEAPSVEADAAMAADGVDESDSVQAAVADVATDADADADADVAMQAAADGEPLDEMGESEGEDEDEDGEGAVLPTSAAALDAQQLKSLVEALVFASDKPLTVPRLRQLTRVADVTRLEQALVEIAADYENRGLILHQVSGGYQFRTRPQYSIWVQQLIAGRPVRLSRAQLETLAIVAYRQPITRPEIDDIRGVDSSATLKLLLDRTLIRPLGKKEEVGRPTLYGTTKEFLDFFSLGDLRELPTLREYSELSEESRRVMSERLGIDPDATPAPSAALASAPTEGDELGGETVQGTRADTESDAILDDGLGGETVQSVDGLGGETVQSMDGEGLDDATIGGIADGEDSAFGAGTVNEPAQDDDAASSADLAADPGEFADEAADALEAMGTVDVYDPPPVDPELLEASADENVEENVAEPVIADDVAATGDVDTSSSESE